MIYVSHPASLGVLFSDISFLINVFFAQLRYLNSNQVTSWTGLKIWVISGSCLYKRALVVVVTSRHPSGTSVSSVRCRKLADYASQTLQVDKHHHNCSGPGLTYNFIPSSILLNRFSFYKMGSSTGCKRLLSAHLISPVYKNVAR